MPTLVLGVRKLIADDMSGGTALMKLVCSKCCQETQASFIARHMHTIEEPRVKDADGHHIAINAKRTWCDGEWLEYTEKENGGMPFGGGVVGLTRWTLADGRVLELRYDSLKGGRSQPHIWPNMDACHEGSRSAWWASNWTKEE